MVTYADKPWTRSYDQGVPASLAPYPDIPLFKLLDDTVQKYPDNTACLTGLKLPLVGMRHATITYRELGESSDRLAAGLVDLDVKKGDRIALVLNNCTQFVICFFGILKAGGIVVALNPTFPAIKWVDQLNDSDARIVISLSKFYADLNKVREQTRVQHVLVTNVKEYFPPLGKTLFTLAKEKKEGHRVESLQPGDFWFQDFLQKYSPSQRPTVQVDPKTDTAIFQYTGGTTGVPKAARGPHSALVANAMQMQCWMVGDIHPADERSLAAIPLFHVYGMVAVMTFAISQGATMIMVLNARDFDDVLHQINTYKPTLFMGVPALYNAINYHPDVVAGKYDLSSIRACISGSAPLAPETKRRFEELTGGVVMEGFGMSEAPTATHCNPLKGVNKEQSIGLPFPDVECRIVSLDDGVTDMPVGEIGELTMRGPVMMTCYHNMPTETANVLRDGWLYTGDIARMDEKGFFYIVDRKKELIKPGGYQVWPREVEEVIMENPKVLEVGVAGVPDAYRGETVKAWVVLKAGETATEEELKAWCKERMAKFKVPTEVEFRTELPKTTVGKILRRELVRQHKEAEGVKA